MPREISNPYLGYAVYAAIKFVGYSIAAKYISRAYAATNRNSYLVGGTRTLIGMATGAAFYFLLLAWEPSYPVMLAALFPIRVIEWWFLVWLFYDRRFSRPGLGWKVALLGSVWSYVCDIPAFVSAFITAGGVPS